MKRTNLVASFFDFDSGNQVVLADKLQNQDESRLHLSTYPPIRTSRPTTTIPEKEWRLTVYSQSRARLSHWLMRTQLEFGQAVLNTQRDLQRKYTRDKETIVSTWNALEEKDRKAIILAGAAGGEDGFLRHRNDPVCIAPWPLQLTLYP